MELEKETPHMENEVLLNRIVEAQIEKDIALKKAAELTEQLHQKTLVAKGMEHLYNNERMRSVGLRRELSIARENSGNLSQSLFQLQFENAALRKKVNSRRWGRKVEAE